jgi:hypothetical protein
MRKTILAPSLFALPLLFLSTSLTHAQVTPPNVVVPDTSYFSLAPGYYSSRTPEQAGREVEIERRYRAVVDSRIPDKKPSNDPWKSVRRAPATAAPVADRHKSQW